MSRVPRDTVILDSKDRLSGSSSTTDFRIKIPYASSKITKYELSKIIIPITYDNVYDINNTFDIDASAYSIPAGAYSISALIVAANALVTGYTFSFGGNSRVTVIKDDTTAFTWTPDETGKLLGFTQTNYTTKNTYTAENYPDLVQNHDYFTLHSEILSGRTEDHVSHSDNRTNILCVIPVVETYGLVQTWEPQLGKFFDIADGHINECDFELKNKNNEVVDLNGHDFMIIFNRY